MTSAVSPLRLLGQIINNSIDVIEGRFAEASLSFPSLDDPFNPTSKSEAILVEPDVITATTHIVAAAAQVSIIFAALHCLLSLTYSRGSC